VRHKKGSHGADTALRYLLGKNHDRRALRREQRHAAVSRALYHHGGWLEIGAAPTTHDVLDRQALHGSGFCVVEFIVAVDYAWEAGNE
jgi:hypothetical protein